MSVIKAPMKASLQGGSLLISTISPSPVSKVCGVFAIGSWHQVLVGSKKQL